MSPHWLLTVLQLQLVQFDGHFRPKNHQKHPLGTGLGKNAASLNSIVRTLGKRGTKGLSPVAEESVSGSMFKATEFCFR